MFSKIWLYNNAIRRKYPTDLNINTESTGAESLTVRGWVLFALQRELDGEIAMKTYTFPNAEIMVLKDGSCVEIPAWCQMLRIPRTRKWVAEALIELRAFNRKSKVAD